MELTQCYTQLRKKPAVPAPGCRATSPTELNRAASRFQPYLLFAGISSSDCTQIVSASREKIFQRRQTIFFQDDPVEQIVLLTVGSVKKNAARREWNGGHPQT
jgi:hypothetical protein